MLPGLECLIRVGPAQQSGDVIAAGWVDFASVSPAAGARSPHPTEAPRCDGASRKVQVIRRISGQRHAAARDWGAIR